MLVYFFVGKEVANHMTLIARLFFLEMPEQKESGIQNKMGNEKSILSPMKQMVGPKSVVLNGDIRTKIKKKQSDHCLQTFMTNNCNLIILFHTYIYFFNRCPLRQLFWGDG